MSDEQTTTEQTGVAQSPGEAQPPTQAVETPRSEAQPAAPQPAQPSAPPPDDPRRRLRELQAIPDRDRSDAVWDEINVLEIQLAPGNRAQAPQADSNGGSSNRRPEQQQARRQQQSPSPGGGKPGNNNKRFFNKSRRPSGPR